MSGLNVFNIYYTKTLKKCLQLQDEVLYITVYIYTLGHKLGTLQFEMENTFYIALFSC